jgi:hypothetical protein
VGGHGAASNKEAATPKGGKDGRKKWSLRDLRPPPWASKRVDVLTLEIFNLSLVLKKHSTM